MVKLFRLEVRVVRVPLSGPTLGVSTGRRITPPPGAFHGSLEGKKGDSDCTGPPGLFSHEELARDFLVDGRP